MKIQLLHVGSDVSRVLSYKFSRTQILNDANPVDPAGPNCYQSGAKPCESNVFRLCGRRGIRLSNTWLTYPEDVDNPGKLGLIRDRP